MFGTSKYASALAFIAVYAQAVTIKDEYDDIAEEVNAQLPEIFSDDDVYEKTVEAVRERLDRPLVSRSSGALKQASRPRPHSCSSSGLICRSDLTDDEDALTDEEDAEVDIKLGDIEVPESIDDLKLDFADLPEIENNVELGDIEDFAVGKVATIELPELKPGLSLALAVDSKEGVIKVAEVPSEVVQKQSSDDK